MTKPKTDSVTTAISEYHRCVAAWKVAEEAADEIIERCYAERRRRLGVLHYKGVEVHSLEHLELMRDGSRPRAESVSEAKEEEAIERLRKGFAAARAEAGLDLEYQTVKAALESVEVGVDEASAKEAAVAAWDAINEAERAAFEVAPSTQTEAAALLRFAAERIDEIGVNDPTIDDVFSGAIRAAAAVLEREAQS